MYAQVKLELLESDVDVWHLTLAARVANAVSHPFACIC